MRAVAALLALSTLATTVARGQKRVALALLLGSEEHRVDAGFGVSHADGLVPGAALGVALGSHWEVRVAGRSGTLAASAGSSDDETVTDVSGTVQTAVAGWLAFDVTGRARSVTTVLARQHWTTVGPGAEARLPFIGSATEGVLRLGVPLIVRASGLAAPTVAIEGGAGLRYRLGRLTGELSYDLRRYDFAPVSGRGRREQISTLTLGLAVGLGSPD